MRSLSGTDSDLLLALHEGALEQPLWQGFLTKLKALTGASCAGLMFHSVDKAEVVELSSGEDLPVGCKQLLMANGEIGGLPRHAMREGRVYALEELAAINGVVGQASPDGLSRSEGVYGRSVRVEESTGLSAWLSILGEREFGAGDGALLGRLVPHVRIALRNFIALERERFRSSLTSEAFGRLNFGWLTLDGACRIVDMTPNIEPLFQRTGLLRRGRYDRLMPASAAVDRELSAIVRGFAQGGDQRPRAINLSHDPWMDMLVAPVQRGSVAAGSMPVAIAYLSGDRWSRSNRCEQLVDLFGLLPSEARLAWALAQGISIGQAAQSLGLTVETARNYSKKIYAKTGASGQAELVRIILTSVLAIA